ncbi:MAG: hypothetical protein UY96_C0010G0029 [Parcubacteria group bacterium GW2011_GWB1_56_8]|nr:MAG: hypothetical protein UY96_C0010G0029 [Parcubacteria group bacterium GW2011_GWB1_56_8]
MNGKAEVTMSKKSNGVETAVTAGPISEIVKSPEALPVTPDASLAEVEYGEGVTIQMEKFEFHRIDVKLTLPARVKSESLEKVYKYAQDWVQKRLLDAMNAARGNPTAK